MEFFFGWGGISTQSFSITFIINDVILLFLLLTLHILHAFFPVYILLTFIGYFYNLDPDSKNLDPEKPGPWNTWTLKNLDLEKHGERLDMEKWLEEHIL